MADLVNLAAESGRNIIGDDTSPTLTLENTSSGNALKLVTTGGTGVVADLAISATAAPTIAVLTTTNSVASGAHFEVKGFLASTASMGSIVRGIRVKYGDNYGWIPVYASATYI